MKTWCLLTLAIWPFIALAQFQTPSVWYGPNSLDLRAGGKPALPEQHASFPIDHNNFSVGVFSNRYWVNDTFYELGGPVFVYDAGVADAQDAIQLLTENGLQSAVMQLARAFHGAGVVLEHRYYGQSVPFAQKEVNGTLQGDFLNLTASELQYLTLDQAVADILYFPQVFSITNGSAFGNVAGDDGLKPDNTPYVILGGGMGGTRAAIARLNGQSSIFASWASSAPVQAQVSFPQYFDNIAKAIPTSNCSRDLQDIRSLVDNVINGTDTSIDPAELTVAALRGNLTLADRGKFNVTDDEDTGVTKTGVQQTSTISLMRQFSVPISFFQVDGVLGAQVFCDNLELAGGDLKKAKDGGLLSFDVPVNRIVDYLFSMNDFQNGQIPLVAQDSRQGRGSQSSQVGRRDDSNDQADDETPVDFTTTDEAWLFQYCTQFGLFIANDNPGNNTSIQSAFVNTAASQAECDQYLEKLTLKHINAPQIDQILKYKGWNMRPTRVFFSDGEFDPWLSATVGSQDATAPKRAANSTVPNFNEISSEHEYFGIVHKNNVHAQDMLVYEGSFPHAKKSFNDSLQLFASALQVWLKNYEPKIHAAEAAAGATASRAVSLYGHVHGSPLAILSAILCIALVTL